MPRPVWSGTISFGLVNVPVKAFTADKGKDVVEADDDAEPTAEVIDLSEALQRSLDSAKGGSRKRRPAAKGRSSKSA